MVYEPNRDNLVLLGGHDDNGILQDTWTWRAGYDFGSVNVGSTSAQGAVVFTFTSGGTIGGAGLWNSQNFGAPGTGTCLTGGPTFSTGKSCTINVTFSPQSAGPSYGALVLYNNAEAVIATAYIQGTGVNGQVAFSPSATSILGGGFSNPYGIAMDSSGNIYVGDTYSNAVKVMAPGCASSSCVTTGLIRAMGGLGS